MCKCGKAQESTKRIICGPQSLCSVVRMIVDRRQMGGRDQTSDNNKLVVSQWSSEFVSGCLLADKLANKWSIIANDVDTKQRLQWKAISRCQCIIVFAVNINNVRLMFHQHAKREMWEFSASLVGW